MKDVKTRTNSVATVLVVATILFVTFNFSTTRETLVAIFGSSIAVNSFAIAVAAIDFAGLARMFVGRGRDEVDYVPTPEEPGLKGILLFVWLIAAIGDIFLTWLWGAITIESNPQMALSPGLASSATVIAPIVVALAEAALRIPLIIALSQQGETWFYKAQVKRKVRNSIPPYRPVKEEASPARNR